MAQAKKPRKTAKRAKSTKSTAAQQPATGPVTLEEARALAKAKLTTRPKGAKAVARKAIAPRTTHASVGAEREKLRERQRREVEMRVEEYKATIAIMKKRGARKARPKVKGVAKTMKVAKGPTAEEAFAPLQILAEGDSWFDYPVPFFGGSIVPRLEDRLGVPILNLAKAGDEVRYMLGVEERTLLAEHLTNGCPGGGPWDVLLFSGGGNDIVDNPMALWVRDWDPAKPPVELVHRERFDAALGLIRAGYEDLIDMRNHLSPNTHLVFHAYEFAIPDGRGICNMGPWLKPTFDLRGFPNRQAAFEVMQEMLKRFAAMLEALATAHPTSITLINGQGTLVPHTSSWHNELHPTRSGFDRFADLFHEKLKALFPNSVA
jgi:hypothetical protein